MVRKGKVSITDKDLGESHIRKLIAQLQGQISGPHVKVGVLADAGQHKDSGGLTVVQIAVFNEFGTDQIPERPFMRLSAEQLAPKIKKFSEFLLAAMVDNKITLDNALDRVGLMAQAHIKKVITDFKDPGNAPSTIYRKARKAGRKNIDHGFAQGAMEGQAALSQYDNPLIDTGQLLGSINYEKVKK